VKRLALYAHYDARGQVKAYVVHHLRALREVCDAVWFISSASLPEVELEKARAVCERVRTRENIGFDFSAWKESIAQIDVGDWDELVLTNSSVFGPLWPLSASVVAMDSIRCDLWSMTDCVEGAWHLQSYFLVFRRKALESEAFRRFWDSVRPLADKQEVIDTYETNLAHFLQESGLQTRALVPWATLPKGPLVWRIFRPGWRNSTLLQPLALLERGMPYVKVELLRDNPMRARLRPVYGAIARSGYDLGMIEIDPRPVPH
jgi:lipopolysaccharide biosynthesis protein